MRGGQKSLDRRVPVRTCHGMSFAQKSVYRLIMNIVNVLTFSGGLILNRSFLINLFRTLLKMITAFLTLLLLQYSSANNKECSRTFGKDYYRALDIGLVDGACQYTKSCLKCMRGFKMHPDQYCEPKSASQARVDEDGMDGDKDPCHK